MGLIFYGVVNPHNYKIWTLILTLRILYITCYCLVWHHCVPYYGPCFHRRNLCKCRWKMFSISGTHYLEMVREKVISYLLEHSVSDAMKFMEKREHPNIINEVKMFLKRTFTEKRLFPFLVTGLNSWILDLDYAKVRVYSNIPFSFVQLKHVIYPEMS